MKKTFLLAAAILCLCSFHLTAWEALDYSQKSNWVISENAEKCDVDVFYVLPTIFSDKNSKNMSWHNLPALQKKARLIAGQDTGIFAEYCRVFAPYYRQAEFKLALRELTLPPAERHFSNRGFADVKNAFRYYLKHHNKGRPFILFGFSQGAVALLEVMKTELADPQINARLVAAYLIGYPAMPKTFPGYPHLRTAQRADDTGCIITYNSQAPGKVKSLFTGSDKYYCINPINWRTDGTLAPAAQHRGSRLYNYKTGKVTDYKNFVSAQVDPKTGALLVIPQKSGKYDSRALGKNVYHLYDLQFFHYDLKENGKLRIRSHRT